MRVLLSMALMGAVVAVRAQEDDGTGQGHGAWLLAAKQPQSQYAVEGKEYVVQYGLYNVGDQAATKITVDDRHSWHKDYFEHVQGAHIVTIPRINPGEHVTHLVVLRPLLAGVYNLTAAKVRYYADDKERDLRESETTVPGEQYIYNRVDYERRFGEKHVYFGIYFALMAITTGYPLSKFLASKWKYDRLDNEGKKYKH